MTPSTPTELARMQRYPSMDLLLQLAIQERDNQRAHFDGLDTKAGVLLAFDGVLVALSHGIRVGFLVPGIIIASASAALALAAVWPRKFPAIDPWVFRQFLTYNTESAGLKVHDTFAQMVTLGRQVLELKARNLKLALSLLLLAVFVLAAGTAFTAADASAGRTQHGVQQHTRTRVSPSAPAASTPAAAS